MWRFDISHPTKGRDLEVIIRRDDPVHTVVEIRARRNSKVYFNENELYHLNKVVSKLFQVKQNKPKKLVRMVQISGTWCK